MTINLEDITLRPYTSADIPVVIERHEVLNWEEFKYPPDKFGKVVSDGLNQLVQIDGSQLWIAEYEPPNTDGNEVSSKLWAGSIGVVPMGEKTCQIRFLLVGSEFRSCGQGQRLLDTALDYCRAEGYKVAALGTTGDCVAAHKLYTRNGFERLKVTQGTPWSKESTLEWWEKKL